MAVGAVSAEHSILVLNAGSSSLKFGLYRGNQVLHADCTASGPSADAAMTAIAIAISERGLPPPKAIGHRIVHGGPHHHRHTRITEAVIDDLQGATPFAPLHQPFALALIRQAQTQFPNTPQVACFDTAFHRDLPALTRTLALPQALRAQGLARYGFHGLSCESIVQQLGDALMPRLVVAHLGSGASVTAIAQGKSIDTSMGLTPSGGLIMATRCGDIDPGVISYLLRERHYDAKQLDALINQQSGLIGISGLSGDMRTLHAAASSSSDARLAIAMFIYSVKKQIAAMAVALGGIDMLVLTGGIGENDRALHDEISTGLAWMGFGTKAVSLRVMRSQEDERIVFHTAHLMAG